MVMNLGLIARHLIAVLSLSAGWALRAQPQSNATRADTASPPPSALDFEARRQGVLTLYFENDYFGGTDRGYTNGVKLSWLSSDLTSWGTGWRKAFAEYMPFINRPDGQKNLGVALGQAMFTPQDTKAFNPDPNDRPYAGWAYLEFSFLSKTDAVADVLAIQVGMVGRHSYAQDVQRVIHKIIGSSRPNGWEYQLADEVGVNVVFERKWRFYARALGDRLGFDLVPHLGASLGNVQTYLNAGATARLGINLPSDFGVQQIRAAGVVSAPLDGADPRVSPVHRWSLFGFAGVDGRAIARDIFLDGNTFKDSRSVDKENFVGDTSYGFGLSKGDWQLTFTRVLRSKEFDRQPQDINDFGSVAISRVF